MLQWRVYQVAHPPQPARVADDEGEFFIDGTNPNHTAGATTFTIANPFYNTELIGYMKVTAEYEFIANTGLLHPCFPELVDGAEARHKRLLLAMTDVGVKVANASQVRSTCRQVCVACCYCWC